MASHLAVTIGAGAILTLASVGGSYALALHAIETTDQTWCGALELLTERPVRAAEGSGPQAEAYRFYVNEQLLERRFGCHPSPGGSGEGSRPAKS